MSDHKYKLVLRDEKNKKIMTIRSPYAIIDLESDKYDVDENIISELLKIIPAEDLSEYSGELLTAQIFVTTIAAGAEKLLESELSRFFPDEILLPGGAQAKEHQSYFKRLGYFTTVVHDDEQLAHDATEWAQKQFSLPVCAKLNDDDAMRQALYYFYAYMAKHQRSSLDQFQVNEIKASKINHR